MIGIIGLILAIVILVVGSYRGLGALPVTLIAAFVAMVTNGIGLWTGFASSYMQGYVTAYMSYFLMFAVSSLYAKLMDESGSASSIGYKFIDWFGKKNVMLVSIAIISVLTYGGVSLFVVVYAVAPIMFLLFKEANLPRHLTMAAIGVGATTYTMASLPGTPQLTNVVPTEFLGTTLMAGPVLGIVTSVLMFIGCMIYCSWEVKKARAKGEGWTFPSNVDPALYEIKDRSLLPPAWKAFLPIIVVLGIIVVGSRFIPNQTMLATVAMLAGAVLTYVLNFERFKEKDWMALLTDGLEGGVSGIGGLAAVLAFGSVVQSTAGYKAILDWVLSLDMHAYMQGLVATSVVAAITGSSSGGLRLVLNAFAETWINSGVNLGTLHRLIAISAGGLDTLPHSPGLFLMFAVLGVDHRTAYRHIFHTSCTIPVAIVIAATAVCMAFGW